MPLWIWIWAFYSGIAIDSKFAPKYRAFWHKHLDVVVFLASITSMFNLLSHEIENIPNVLVFDVVLDARAT